jgi:hypothetical protein
MTIQYNKITILSFLSSISCSIAVVDEGFPEIIPNLLYYFIINKEDLPEISQRTSTDRPNVRFSAHSTFFL